MTSTDYERYVASAANAMSNQVISGSSMAHANILVKNLLKIARQDICIISNRLDGSFWKYLSANIDDALARGCSIRILCLRQIDHSAIADLAGMGCEKLQVREYSGEDYLNNFMVVDRCSYRFEPNGERLNAVCNFNDPHLVSIFKDQFESLWARGRVAE
jgi:hypothetical protein